MNVSFIKLLICYLINVEHLYLLIDYMINSLYNSFTSS